MMFVALGIVGIMFIIGRIIYFKKRNKKCSEQETMDN